MAQAANPFLKPAPEPEVDVEPETDAPKRAPKILPFDDFCLRFFTSNEQGVLNLLRNNDLTQAAGGLCGIITKAYKVYVMAVEAGWSELGESE